MKQVVKVFFILFLILLFPVQSQATNEFDDSAKPHYKNGTITWTTKDKKASPKTTSWKTIGFTLRADKCKISSSGEPKGNDGNPRKDNKYATLMLQDEWKVSKLLDNTTVETTFTIPQEEVTKAVKKAKINSMTLKLSGGNIYLNGIFKINYRNGKSEKILKTKEGICKLREIMYPDGVFWTRPQDFRDRFDVPVPYDPKPVPVYLTTMRYDTKKYTIIQRKKITSVKPHTNFETKTNQIPAKLDLKSGEDCYLYRTYWADMGEKEKEHKNGTYRRANGDLKTNYNPKLDFENYKVELRQLRNRFYDVTDQGIEIVCVYKKYKKASSKYCQEEIEEDIIEPFVDGIIQADERGREKFDSKEGIPSSEMQYVNVTTSEYLTQYKFRRYYGTKTYRKRIPTKKKKNKDGALNPDRYVEVLRSYSYWKIIDLNVYKLAHATVCNDSLPNHQITLLPSSDYSIPKITYVKHHNHLEEPVNGETTIGDIKVRNDSLIFNGKTIMSDNWCNTTTIAPNKLPVTKRISDTVCFANHLLVDAKKANGIYESEGYVTYRRICHIGADLEGSEIEYAIDNINNVTVHTPTICNIVLSDAKSYNQLLCPDRSVAGLVLDRKFRVSVPSNGYHSNLKGYGENDFSKYISKKEVKFSFDVYKNREFYSAGSWVTVNESDNEFYLPIWVSEGYHSIKARTRTINCDFNHKLEKEESNANVENENYVATDEKMVEVSGRLYGLTLYDISDYPIWRSVFRKNNSVSLTGIEYKIGCNNQNGCYVGRDAKQTFVMVNGSHPYFPNIGIQKTGYVSRFYLTSVGNLNSSYDEIRITPTYFYIGKNGERMEADVYYTETIGGKNHSLVKIGSELDKKNRKNIRLGEIYLSVPESEIEEKAKLVGCRIEKIKSEQAKAYSFCNIVIPEQLRTYIGANYTPDGKIPVTVDEKQVAKAMQKWYFEFYLPSEIHVCKKGYNILSYEKKKYGIDYKEPFWLKDGYLLVNFQIETVSDGVRKLSYTNEWNSVSGYCNMWEKEGFQYQKRDFFGRNFYFKNGDALLYYIEKSAARDYINSGTH